MKKPKAILLSKGGKRKMRDKLYPLGLVLILGALVLSNCGSGEEAKQPGVAETLVGTEWVLTSLNGEGLIEGTEINLYFREAFLGGSMTCNRYGGGPDSGKYVATDDGTLTLPQSIAVTVQLCSEPEGIMEQEATYIEALRSAASYRVVDDRLEIDNAAGETTLVFVRKCEMHAASMMLTASVTMLEVGETITVTVTLSNEGCVALGMPQYWLGVEYAEEESIFDPSQPQSVVHYLAVPPGQSDMAEFVLRAVESGQATLAASASFEMHLGYPGPAYWAGSSTKEPLVVIVKP